MANNTSNNMSPSRENRSNVSSNDDDLTKYGYEDAEPTTASRGRSRAVEAAPPAPRRGVPRRSSMKSLGCSRRDRSVDRGEIEISIPAGGKIRRRVSIGYADRVEVKEVTPLSELVSDERQIWFQSDDFRNMKDKAVKLASAVQEGRTGKPRDYYCTRGLESFINDEEWRSRKYKAIDAVMDEQDVQFDRGTFNEHDVAKLYMETSRGSKLRAEQLANQDAAEVRTYTKDIRRMMRRLSM